MANNLAWQRAVYRVLYRSSLDGSIAHSHPMSTVRDAQNLVNLLRVQKETIDHSILVIREAPAPKGDA